MKFQRHCFILQPNNQIKEEEFKATYFIPNTHKLLSLVQMKFLIMGNNIVNII